MLLAFDAEYLPFQHANLLLSNAKNQFLFGRPFNVAHHNFWSFHVYFDRPNLFMKQNEQMVKKFPIFA